VNTHGALLAVVLLLLSLALGASDGLGTTALGILDVVTTGRARRGVLARRAVRHLVGEVDLGVVRARNVVAAGRHVVTGTTALAGSHLGARLGSTVDGTGDALVRSTTETTTLVPKLATRTLSLAGNAGEAAATVAGDRLSDRSAAPGEAAGLVRRALSRGVARAAERLCLAPRLASGDSALGGKAEGEEEGCGIHYV